MSVALIRVLATHTVSPFMEAVVTTAQADPAIIHQEQQRTAQTLALAYSFFL